MEAALLRLRGQEFISEVNTSGDCITEVEAGQEFITEVEAGGGEINRLCPSSLA